MITVHIISDRSEIERHVPLCINLAQSSGNELPFQHLHMPLVWWDHFNNTDGTDFSKKRGQNFIGLQSRLQKLLLLVSSNGSDIIGTVPIVIYSVRLSGEKYAIPLITFPGDLLIAYHDFNVAPKLRNEAIKSLLETMVKMLDGRGLIMLSHIPENSPSISALMQCMNDLSTKGFHCRTAVTGSSGGVRAWTTESIISCLRQITDKISDPFHKDEVMKLLAEIDTCPPIKLSFPKTRNNFEDRIRNIINSINNNIELENTITELEAALSNSSIEYLYIQLPKDRETYFNTFSKASRKHIRNMRNKFVKNGGGYEKIDSLSITDQDIDDYLRLHDMRWGDESISIVNEATYNSQKELCRSLSSEECFTLFFALYQGKRIASISCIDIQGRREAIMAGRDLEYDRTSSGFLLMLETIMDAIDHGFHTFDFGMGWYAYKTRFTKSSIHTLNFFIVSEISSSYFTKLFQGYECMISI